MASSGWTQIYQGNTNDSWIPFSIIQTIDDGYAMLVFADAQYVDDIGYPGHFTTKYELYLIKMDSSGNINWKQTFAKSENSNSEFYYFSPSDMSGNLIQTSNGDYFINSGLWLIKTNSQGQLLWMKSNWQDEDSAYSSYAIEAMIQTKDEGFAMAGSTQTPQGGIDFWLVKADSQGNKQWSQTYNSGTFTNAGETIPREETATSLIQTSDGGYALAGQTTTYSSLSSTYETWLVKTDSQGQKQWSEIYSGSNMAGAKYQVIQKTDGGFALLTTQLQEYDFNKFKLITTDSSGKKIWEKNYGDKKVDSTGPTKYDNWPCSLVQLNDGGFAIAGTMTEASNWGPVSRDLAIVRVNSAGTEIWTKTFNAQENSTLDQKSDDFAYCMVLTNDGSYALAGQTVTAWEGNHRDVFFVKTESLEEPKKSSTSLTVTEVSGSVKIQSPAQQDSWSQVNDGEVLEQGSKIKTEQNEGTLELSEGISVEIQPNTNIEVTVLTESDTTLLLQEGEFTAEITELPEGEKLRVNMSQAVAEITGTIFTVTETGNESTLYVKQGSVVFTSKIDGQTITVQANQKVVATNQGLEPTIAEAVNLDLSSIIILVVAVIIICAVIVFIIKRKKPAKISSH